MENIEICSLMDSYAQSPSKEKKRKLVNAMAVYIFFNLKCILVNQCPADEDAKSEFILWLYPQLERIVDHFDPQKAAFHTYVSVGVKYRYLRFCAERARAKEIMQAAENEEMKLLEGYSAESFDDSQCACEKPAVYKSGNKPREKEAGLKGCNFKLSGKTEAAKKRIARDVLLLTLKSAFYLSEDLIEKVSDVCEIPRDRLDNLLEAVRRDYGERHSIYERLRLRRYSYYLRALRCRKKLSELRSGSSASDSEKIRSMEKEREFCDRQSLRLYTKMEKLQRNPSNRYLAGLLDMPRGSVNSALVRIKKHMYSFGHGDSSSDL